MGLMRRIWNSPGKYALLLCGMASAQSLLVETTTLSASREAARVYLQSIDIRAGGGLPEPEILPGLSPTGPLLLSHDGKQAWLSTTSTHRSGNSGSRSAWPYVSVYETSPLRKTGSLEFAREWRPFAACIGRDLQRASATLDSRLRGNDGGGRGNDGGGHESLAVLLGNARDPSGIAVGRIQTYAQAGLESGTPFASADLDGTPVAAVALPPGGRVAVLCKDAAGTGCLLYVVNMATGEKLLDRHSVHDLDSRFRGNDDGDGIESPLGTAPCGLAVAADGRFLFVLTSGYPVDQPTSEASSWLHVLSTDSFEEYCPPELLPGMAHPEDAPLCPTGESACWAATRTPETSFAYATCIHVEAQGAHKEAQVSLTGVTVPLRIAPAPSENAVAVGIENRLEVWHGNHRGRAFFECQAPVSTVSWTNEGLFMGENSRVHQIDPATCTALRTVQLQSGWVTGLALVPASSSPAPNLDGDGIPDGVDPEPATPSPRLAVPSEVLFHEEAMGQEVKGFRIDSPYAEHSRWRVTFDREQMPWLVIHPLQGSVPGVVYLGIDPGRYRPGGTPSETLTVTLTGSTPKVQAANSPAQISVHVVSRARAAVRRILWIWSDPSAPSFRDASDPHRLRAVGDVLAAPPLHFAHREAAAPYLESLESYAVVVLNPEAALQGALTRQALLDYVLEGGSLLFLGQYVPEQNGASLEQWLSPIHIRIDTNTRVDGVFPIKSQHPLCRALGSLPIANGCAVQTDLATSILAPAPRDATQALLLARTYGRGRIAVLASATPLETSAMASQSNNRFAADLFRWLAQAGTYGEEQDLDGDGLPDSVEDRNGNGIVDPGETDFLNPDTDGDGIPDGMEDSNRNGTVDDGETSPLNPDSNGNGIWDGADLMPLPPPGAPSVASVNPAQGPAEGGGLALVSGQHFASDAIVWFGDRQAPQIRVLRSTDAIVEVPPCSLGPEGDTPVRITNTSSGLYGVLPSGYHYGPRSVVGMALHMLRAELTQQKIYEGAVSIRVDPPPGIAVEQVVLLLRATPHDGFQWGTFAAMPPGGNTRWQVVCRQTHSGDLLIAVLRGKSGAAVSGEIGPIPWEFTPSPERDESLALSIEQPRALAHNGQPFEVLIQNATEILGSRK